MQGIDTYLSEPILFVVLHFKDNQLYKGSRLEFVIGFPSWDKISVSVSLNKLGKSVSEHRPSIIGEAARVIHRIDRYVFTVMLEAAMRKGCRAYQKGW